MICQGLACGESQKRAKLGILFDMAENAQRPIESETRLPTPEQPRVPEALPEQAPEHEWQPDWLEPTETQAEQPTAAPAPVRPTAPKLIPSQSLFVREIEQIMAADLDQSYRELDAPTQAKFKQVGETTANTIADLLAQTKVQTKKILELIVNWLRIIPGVNTFFLEQEAKIKTDKLLALRRPHDTP